MNIDKLDNAFRNMTELEVVRLLTCDFNIGAFSLVESVVYPKLVPILKEAIKFKTHLDMEPTTLEDFVNKINSLSYNASQEYTGSASKVCGYSGMLLTESETFLGTPEKLVSPNEYSYFIKMYPWWVRPVNPEFVEHAQQYVDSTVFLCLHSFDLEALKEKADVESVSEERIVLKGNVVLPVVRVG